MTNKKQQKNFALWAWRCHDARNVHNCNLGLIDEISKTKEVTR